VEFDRHRGFPILMALPCRSLEPDVPTTAISAGRRPAPTLLTALINAGMCLAGPIDCGRLQPESLILSKSAARARLAEIIRKRSFGRGEITLASGRKSDFYFNLKPTMCDPKARRCWRN
jgi:hypothetical protein